MNELFVTLDIDWAPDAAIHAAADILEEHDCRATWFVTHRTPVLDRLRGRNDLFELGIHPNFLPGSSHGREPEEVLRHVLDIVPDARCVRAHAATQSGPILKAMAGFSQIELDCTLMLPALRHAAAVPYGDGVRALWRVPNFWSDDYEAEMRRPNWAFDERFSVPGLKVLIFHPIHVALNTERIETYRRLKLDAPDMSAWSKQALASSRRNGVGAATFFQEVVSRLGRAGGGATLSALIPQPAG